MSQTLHDVEDGAFSSIFDWINRAKRPFWILFFIILSLAAHILCFYLFSVVYPEQKRRALRSMELTLLDGSNPKSVSIMNQINDRLIVLDEGNDSAFLLEDPQLEQIGFKPFFKNFKPTFESFKPQAVKSDEGLINFDQFYLPPLNGSNMIGKNVNLKNGNDPNIAFFWESDARKVVKEFEWMDNANAALPNTDSELVIQIGVNRFGKITHLFPEKSVSPEIEDKVVKALKDMRFSRISAEKTSWATVEFSW
ncbi:MAG: hypothetical protein CMO46_06745 [Verrucomicrobiales bacterium]|nr:hypothetical protein [Verrucomicrobiales bacterium]MBV63293.1 hypothetical protein [Rickettsiales bacterium]|tara:strand:- start:693 stop:1448 length:756 start_codon:yes stop_codon:yes gene_type:complete